MHIKVLKTVCGKTLVIIPNKSSKLCTCIIFLFLLMTGIQNRIIATAALFGLLAIAIGAMGAHFLKDSLDTKQLGQIETAARYQMYGALTLLGLGTLAGKIRKSFAKISYIAFTLGILFFSFSLYGIVACDVLSINLPKFVFLITPVGGLLLMFGWGTLFYYAIKNLYVHNDDKRKKAHNTSK